MNNNERYYIIEKSMIQALKEVCLMRDGKLPKKSLQDLFDKIELWKNDKK